MCRSNFKSGSNNHIVKDISWVLWDLYYSSDSFVSHVRWADHVTTLLYLYAKVDAP